MKVKDLFRINVNNIPHTVEIDSSCNILFEGWWYNQGIIIRLEDTEVIKSDEHIIYDFLDFLRSIDTYNISYSSNFSNYILISFKSKISCNIIAKNSKNKITDIQYDKLQSYVCIRDYIKKLFNINSLIFDRKFEV